MGRQPWGCAPVAASRASVAKIARAVEFVRTFSQSLIATDLFRLLQPSFTPESAEVARHTLEHLADYPESGLHRHAEAIRNFRAGLYRSLDEAFGLVAPKRPGKGAPRKLSKRIDAGNQIENCLLRGESMREVTDRLSDAAPHGDSLEETHVHRTYREFRKLRSQLWSAPIMSSGLTGRLIDLVGLPDCDVGEGMPQAKRKSKTNKSINSRSR